jgi:adenosylhomocysteine nucleosidase
MAIRSEARSVANVLLVAAESREFAGLLRRAAPSRRLSWPLRFAAEIERHAVRWILAANGPGPGLARVCVQVAAARARLDAVVSTGFCGGLDPSLERCQVFLADTVWSPGRDPEFRVSPPRKAASAATGRLLSVNRVVNSIAEKAEWRQKGAAAVDMEAFAVAEEAARRELPFFCVRIVTDAAKEGFPMDFNAVRDAEGRFSRARIVWEALRRPRSRIPFLVSLDRGLRQASGILGDFLASCEF